MNSLFPFGFPFPTAMYLTLYVVTLVVHVVFMNYVLAGAGYLAVSTIYRLSRHGNPQPSIIANIVRDWLPFALSAAITAGVAPLLFVQILYKEDFYSANLLLLHRWMAILPVLIVGFYLLYLMKSGWALRRSPWMQISIAVITFLCFAFVAWSWTENHLLSLQRASWPSFYEQQQTFYRSSQLLPRLLMWTVGSVPTFCWMVLLQLRFQPATLRLSNDDHAQSITGATIHLARLAILGVLITVGAAAWYIAASKNFLSDAAFGSIGRVWFIVAMAGVVAQIVIWFILSATRRLDGDDGPPRLLAIAGSTALLGTILGMSIVREILRLNAIDITQLYTQHKDAAQVGGFWIFFIFAVINIGAIAYCIRMAKRTSN